MRSILGLVILSILLCWSCTSKQVTENEQTTEMTPKNSNRLPAFVGTYTRTEGHVDGQAKGIYEIGLDTSDGTLFRIKTIPNIINPSFITYAPNGKFMYAVSEVGGGEDTTGHIYAYGIQGEEVQFINREISHGIAPCHLTVHPSGKYLFVANYMGGIAMYPIQQNGSLSPASHVQYLIGSGPHPRQAASHPHSITLDQEGRFAYVADLGTDKIMIFSVDLEKGSLEPAAVPFTMLAPGAGPRHLSFHPNGQLVYAINELNSTITTFSYDRADGHLEALQTVSTLPTGFTGENSCADIHLQPNGRFLYGSNRGHNSIAMFAIDSNTGFLEPIGHQSTLGEIPRNFAIDPSGQFLFVANQNSDNIVRFRLNPQTGGLEHLGELRIPTPVCIQFAPVPKPS